MSLRLIWVRTADLAMPMRAGGPVADRARQGAASAGCEGAAGVDSVGVW